ncbi:unnamed protein product [Arabidopsis halleri]
MINDEQNLKCVWIIHTFIKTSKGKEDDTKDSKFG